jgi:opacity protein-like surface antigen
MFGLKPNLFTVALERPLYRTGPWSFGARLYAQVGKVEGAITCSGDVVAHPPASAGNPFGCEEKSKDDATQNYAGLELSAAHRFEQWGGLTAYVTAAGNYFDTKVRVNALTFGLRDRTREDSESWIFSAGAGAEYPLTDRLTFGAGVFYSPQIVTRPPYDDSENDALFNARALLTWRFR